MRTASLALAVSLHPTTGASADTPVTSRCAIRLRVTATIKDVRGKAVVDAELWYVDTLGDTIDASYASRIGISDTRGHVGADVCFASELFYCANPPRGKPALRFFVLKEGYGALRLTHVARAEALTKEGWAFVGAPCTGKGSSLKIGEEGVNGYSVPLDIILRPVQ
jgi:hypothetical protein